MKTQTRSILVISSDPAVSGPMGKVLSALPQTRVVTETGTLSGMNGRAARLAAEYDVVLFQSHPDDAAEIEAVRALAAARRPGGIILAIADSGIALTEARALNRAGVDEVLPIGSDPGEIGALLGRRSAAEAGGRLGRVIAVAQARGGVGSTTVAVNLADQLASERHFLKKERHFPVALVDFDLQFGTVGSFLDLPEQDTLLQIAMDGTIPDATFLAQSMVKTDRGVSVLAAPSKFAPIDSLRPEQVAAILDTLRQTHDYVVVDLPRALVGWIEPIVDRADELVVVTDTTVPSVRHCRRLIDFFTAEHVALPVKVVVNHEGRPLLRSSLHRETQKVLERPLDHWLPHDPKAARAAADRGRPLSAVAPNSSLARAMSKLAEATRAAAPESTTRPLR